MLHNLQQGFHELIQHAGHKIAIEPGPDPRIDPDYVTIECKTCDCTLIELEWDDKAVVMTSISRDLIEGCTDICQEELSLWLDRYQPEIHHRLQIATHRLVESLISQSNLPPATEYPIKDPLDKDSLEAMEIDAELDFQELYTEFRSRLFRGNRIELDFDYQDANRGREEADWIDFDTWLQQARAASKIFLG